jgi:hypothetical protein
MPVVVPVITNWPDAIAIPCMLSAFTSHSNALSGSPMTGAPVPASRKSPSINSRTAFEDRLRPFQFMQGAPSMTPPFAQKSATSWGISSTVNRGNRGLEGINCIQYIVTGVRLCAWGNGLVEAKRKLAFEH